MIQYQMTQTFRVACDRCGYGGSSWHERIEPARTEALNVGFHLSEWMENGSARELWLCFGCFQRREWEEDKRNTDVVKDGISSPVCTCGLTDSKGNLQRCGAETHLPVPSHKETPVFTCPCSNCVEKNRIGINELLLRKMGKVVLPSGSVNQEFAKTFHPLSGGHLSCACGEGSIFLKAWDYENDISLNKRLEEYASKLFWQKKNGEWLCPECDGYKSKDTSSVSKTQQTPNNQPIKESSWRDKPSML